MVYYSIKHEFGIPKKCNSSLEQKLLKWYLSFPEEKSKFPPEPVNVPLELLSSEKPKHQAKIKVIYDQNKNKIEIVLPSDIKSNKMALKKTQQEI